MGVIEVEWEQIATDLVRVGLASALALPIAWERGRGRANVGLRTLPIVANGGLRVRHTEISPSSTK